MKPSRRCPVTGRSIPVPLPAGGRVSRSSGQRYPVRRPTVNGVRKGGPDGSGIASSGRGVFRSETWRSSR